MQFAESKYITGDQTDTCRLAETAYAREELHRTITDLLGTQDELVDERLGISLYRCTASMGPTSLLFKPSISIIPRGRKRVVLGTTTYLYDESRFLLTALDLPTVVQVLDASFESPYSSALIKLNLPMANQIIGEMDVIEPKPVTLEPGIATGPATASLLNVVSRQIELLKHPEDIPFLAESLHRELLYRILRTDAAAYLREVVRLGTQGNNVARAVEWLRHNFQKPFRAEELASIAAMSVSTLQHQFRLVTSLTPLQYQKHLRLHHARHLLLTEGTDIATAADKVGYKSVTQFTREYRRLFNMPPARDIRSLRT